MDNEFNIIRVIDEASDYFDELCDSTHNDLKSILESGWRNHA
jgi:hypothetical protein